MYRHCMSIIIDHYLLMYNFFTIIIILLSQEKFGSPVEGGDATAVIKDS